jgi:CubicO group peptidase (beta-lactamase class C family)
MTDVATGDPELSGRLDRLVRGEAPAAVALLTPDGATMATRAAETTSDFEIGSISKGVTGMLYVDARARGEITSDTTLGDLLPLGDCPAASVSLGSLSTHHSGLPGLPPSMQPVRRTVDLWRHGTNPYGHTLDELLVQAREVAVGAPRARYSNLGFQLLGHAVAAAAGTTYRQLLRERLVEPLDLRDTYVPATPEQLRQGAVEGTSRYGRPRQPWTGEAIGPAGGIRSSIADMARLTQAILDGSAPGVAALAPVTTFAGRARIGAAWIAIEGKGRAVTLHNGGTGGFRSWMGVDLAAGIGAVVLSATTQSVDRAGFSLVMDAQRS